MPLKPVKFKAIQPLFFHPPQRKPFVVGPEAQIAIAERCERGQTPTEISARTGLPLVAVDVVVGVFDASWRAWRAGK